MRKYTAINQTLKCVKEELHNKSVALSECYRELKKVNEQLEQFTFISNHNLQEPLRKISVFSDLLLKYDDDPGFEAKKYITKINASACRMSRLVKDLTNFLDLCNKGVKILENVDLNTTLKAVLEDFELVIEDKSAVIKLCSLPVIPAEPNKMYQLFFNLISNALKFSRGIPVITISSTRTGAEDFSNYPELKKDSHYISICVHDNGIGFDQEYVSKIFNLFQKLDGTENSTGTGLAVCKKIVEDHKGFIFAKGEENVGATFTIFLPVP